MKLWKLTVFLLFVIAACANSQQPPPTPTDVVSSIELVETKQMGDWTAEFFVNKEYTCAKEGYHTFLVISPSGDGERPLWIRFHGGGAGAFGEDGTYTARDFRIEEESFEALGQYFGETGLVSYVKQDPAGFRFLLPGMCDHDFYGGVGAIDKYNPYSPDENGEPRRVDGSLAAQAAYAYVRQNYETSHVFAHGTSAGSGGAMNLVLAVSEQGRRLSGAVLDSGVMSPLTQQIQNVPCREKTFESAGGIPAVFGRSGPYGVEGNMPHDLIARGVVTTPLYEIWSREDSIDCRGTILEASHDGSTYKGTSSDLMRKLLDDAIDKYNPGGASEWRKTCVDDPDNPDWKCDLHVATRFSADENGGDLDRNGEDYNLVVYEWVQDRLNDPVPN